MAPFDLTNIQWARTSELTQPAPIPWRWVLDRFIVEQNVYIGGDARDVTSIEVLRLFLNVEDQFPYLFWGNSAKIIGVRPVNSTYATSICFLGELLLSTSGACTGMKLEYHADVAPQQQEYLMRPRFLTLNFDLTVDEPWLDLDVVTISPSFQAFEIMDSDPIESTVLFAESDIIGPGKEFTVWASNPSGSMWMSPASALYPAHLYNSVHNNAFGQVVGPPIGAEDIFPTPVVYMEWVVACRWANGTDCAPAPVICGGDTDPEHILGADGLCWQRTTSSIPRVGFGNLLRSQSQRKRISPYDIPPDVLEVFINGSSSFLPWLTIMPRPLALSLYNPSQTSIVTESFLHPIISGFQPVPLVLQAVPGAATQELAISFPLLGQNNDIAEYIFPSPLTGSVEFEQLHRWLPGRDNVGGSLTVSLAWVVELLGPDTMWLEDLGRYQLSPGRAWSPENTTVRMEPSSIVISADQPFARFRLNGLILNDSDVHGVQLFFKVVETSSSPSTVENTNTSASGVWQQGAYYLPSLLVHVMQPQLTLSNGPGVENSNTFIVAQPVEHIKCPNASYTHMLRLNYSPEAMNQSSVRCPFNVSGIPPQAVQFWTCASTNGGKRQSSSPTLIDPMVGFEFVGSNTALEFSISTTIPLTHVNPVLLTFLVPSLAEILVPAPVGLVLKQNDLHVSLQNDAAADDGPYLFEWFYLQITFTPPTVSGFNFIVSGLDSEFSGSPTLANNNTRAAYFVPGNVTGALIGPMRAIAVPSVAPSAPSFTIVYSLGVEQAAQGSNDYLWYSLSSAVLVRLCMQKLVLANLSCSPLV